MPTLNYVALIGNLTRDPDLRYTQQGVAVADFSIGVNRKFKNKEGQTRDEVAFIEVIAWGKTGEAVSTYLKKGGLCLIEGRLVQERWEGQDGRRHSKIKVTAERVQFLGQRSKEEGGGPMEPSEEAAPEDTAH